jgi:hypothetical protein
VNGGGGGRIWEWCKAVLQVRDAGFMCAYVTVGGGGREDGSLALAVLEREGRGGRRPEMVRSWEEGGGGAYVEKKWGIPLGLPVIRYFFVLPWASSHRKIIELARILQSWRGDGNIRRQLCLPWAFGGAITPNNFPVS